MSAKEKIIVGLEVGTSKVCAVVGEVLEDGNIMVIGVGQTKSEGVRKGEVVNIETAVDCVHTAVADAEESAGVEIHNVYASVSGGHIHSFNKNKSIEECLADEIVWASNSESKSYAIQRKEETERIAQSAR